MSVQRANAEIGMVYVFEFYAMNGVERQAIDRMTHRAKSVDQAKDHARAMMRNVKLRDKTPDIVIVKDQMGHTLGEVSGRA
jgi:hypothetical protein